MDYPAALRAVSWIAAFVVLTSLGWYATTRPRLPTGFTARYYAGGQTTRPTVSSIDDRVSTAVVRRSWPLVDQPFDTRWDASFFASRSATYRFSLISDGSSTLYLDNRIAVDNGGPHGPRQVTEEIRLDRGVHPLRLEYAAPVNAFGVDLLWATGSVKPLTALTGRAVSPSSSAKSELLTRTAVDLTRVAIVCAWTLVFAYLAAARVIAPAMSQLVRHHLPAGIPGSALMLLAVVALLYTIGIAWGIPGQGWAPDELIPPDFFDALDRHFSNGWWSKYPPAHFYVCAIATAPLLLWRWLDPAAFGASLAPDVLWMTFRAITVAMGVGTVAMAYVCGTYVYEARAAWAAAAISALTLPAMFYAKTANLDVPYVFWFSIALASFIRLLIDDSPFDYIAFALAASLAICTKDQAYGLFVLPAAALGWRAFVRADRWRHLLKGFALAALTFALCHNLLFNLEGFRSHVEYITGKGATPFRMFESTLAGQWQLLQATWLLARVSMGWPAFLLCLAGLAISVARHDARSRRLWWLLLPSVSYYLTFSAVVGFTYDRFLLPVFIALAFAGGLCVSELERLAPERRGLIRSGLAAVLVFTLAYAFVIDVAMMRDPRYDVERWMRENVEPGATIGRVGPIEHVPRIDQFYTVLVTPTVDGIRTTALDYIVVNADWVERFGPSRPEFQGYRELREGRLGYRQVFEARRPIRFAGMSLDRRFTPFGSIGYSTLTKLNPPTVVFRRDAANREMPVPSARTP